MLVKVTRGKSLSGEMQRNKTLHGKTLCG